MYTDTDVLEYGNRSRDILSFAPLFRTKTKIPSVFLTVVYLADLHPYFFYISAPYN